MLIHRILQPFKLNHIENHYDLLKRVAKACGSLLEILEVYGTLHKSLSDHAYDLFKLVESCQMIKK